MTRGGRPRDCTGEALTKQLGLDAPAVGCRQVGQSASVTVLPLHRLLDHHGACTDQLTKCAGCFRSQRLVRLTLLPQLRCVDPCQADGLAIIQNQRITIDHMSYLGLPDVSRLGQTGHAQYQVQREARQTRTDAARGAPGCGVGAVKQRA